MFKKERTRKKKSQYKSNKEISQKQTKGEKGSKIIIKGNLTCIVRKVSFVRRTKYSRKLYELNDCDVRSMLWYKLKMACRLGAPTDIFEFSGIQVNEYGQNDVGERFESLWQMIKFAGRLVLLFPKAFSFRCRHADWRLRLQSNCHIANIAFFFFFTKIVDTV